MFHRLPQFIDEQINKEKGPHFIFKGTEKMVNKIIKRYQNLSCKK
jgi:hypothetical protein